MYMYLAIHSNYPYASVRKRRYIHVHSTFITEIDTSGCIVFNMNM